MPSSNRDIDLTQDQDQARVQPDDIEHGTLFQPKYDANGLLTVVVTASTSGEVLMVAWMTEAALAETIRTKIVHFWSRSRRRLWKKGEDSGNVLAVVEMRVDCDQDTLWIKADVQGAGVACHTGSRSCFYRVLERRADGGVNLVPDGSGPRLPKFEQPA